MDRPPRRPASAAFSRAARGAVPRRARLRHRPVRGRLPPDVRARQGGTPRFRHPDRDGHVARATKSSATGFTRRSSTSPISSSARQRAATPSGRSTATATARSRYLTFEPEELAAVADGAARIRQLGDPFLAEHADSAMRKLACRPAGGCRRRRRAADRPAAGQGARLSSSRHSARRSSRRKHVTFDYRGMGSDAVGGEDGGAVRPLLPQWAAGILAARAPGEETVKIYRLNRIGTGTTGNEKRPGCPHCT